MADNFNTLEKQPRPTDYSGVGTAGLTSLQRQYIDTLSNQPSSLDLFKQYREELGIPEREEIVSGLNRSILDLEGKIKDVEGSVKERTRDFLVTEAQRKRIQTVEETPLREQYLESLRRREAAQSELGGANSLLGQTLGFAGEDLNRPLTLLDTLMGFQNKGGGSGFTLDLGGGATPAQIPTNLIPMSPANAPQYSAPDGTVEGSFISLGGNWYEIDTGGNVGTLQSQTMSSLDNFASGY